MKFGLGTICSKSGWFTMPMSRTTGLVLCLFLVKQNVKPIERESGNVLAEVAGEEHGRK